MEKKTKQKKKKNFWERGNSSLTAGVTVARK